MERKILCDSASMAICEAFLSKIFRKILNFFLNSNCPPLQNRSFLEPPLIEIVEQSEKFNIILWIYTTLVSVQADITVTCAPGVHDGVWDQPN